MQFLDPEQTLKRFSCRLSGIDETNAWYRKQLIFKDDFIRFKRRVVGGSPSGMSYTAFVHALMDWLPGDGSRLLWVSHAEDGLHGYSEVFDVLRRGLGADRSLNDQPAIVFRPAPWHEFDTQALAAHDQTYLNMACGLISMVHLGAWDGWLFDEAGEDLVEFWEGNVFFHSRKADSIREAVEILRRFNCAALS